MNWMRLLQVQAGRWAEAGIDLVYPPRCSICRREPGPVGNRGTESMSGPGWPASSAPVCDACARELSTDPARCPRCGEPGAAAAGCRQCRRSGHAWRFIAILSSYGGPVRESVLRAKRPAGDEVAAGLATLLVRKHRESLEAWGVGSVVPVPMHWLRRSLRGASAADALAGRIAAQLGRPMSRMLVRRRATRMQNELPIGDRPRNVLDAFRCRRRVDGERLLLVDDVATTGATLSACSRALLAAGAATVDVAVVARADRSDVDD